MKSNKTNSYKFGLIAEFIVCIFLFFQGYKILERRFKTKFGEIDIICKRAENIVFVEVKARKNNDNQEVLTSKQMKRIFDASRYFLTKNNKFSDYNSRFDLIIFNSPLSIKHIKNAWSF